MYSRNPSDTFTISLDRNPRVTCLALWVYCVPVCVFVFTCMLACCHRCISACFTQGNERQVRAEMKCTLQFRIISDCVFWHFVVCNIYSLLLFEVLILGLLLTSVV